MHRNTKSRMAYFAQDDVLHITISHEPEARSIELIPNVTVELNDKGEMIGIELLNASAFLRDVILESIPGKMLELSEA